MSAINEAIELVRPHAQGTRVAGRAATRFFMFWFPVVSIVIYGTAMLLLNAYASEELAKACYFGLALCTLTSVVSFFITEWAVELPTGVFMGIAFGSMFVRIFVLLFAFAIAQFVFKMNSMGMAFGMLTAYFSYLVVELTYVHKKALKRGH